MSQKLAATERPPHGTSGHAFTLAFAAVVLAGALALFAPALLRARDAISSTPVPAPLVRATPVALPPHARLCIAGATLSPDAARARLAVAAAGPAVPVTLTVRGAAGHRATGHATAPAPPGPLDVAFAPAPAEQDATICLRNDGTQPLALVGSLDPRTAPAPAATIDGQAIAPRVELLLLERGRHSLLARTPAVLEHASAFRPSPIRPWLLWPALVAVAAGLPLGVAAAVRASRSVHGAG